MNSVDKARLKRRLAKPATRLDIGFVLLVRTPAALYYRTRSGLWARHIDQGTRADSTDWYERRRGRWWDDAKRYRSRKAALLARAGIRQNLLDAQRRGEAPLFEPPESRLVARLEAGFVASVTREDREQVTALLAMAEID